jgi:hypothetical protein
MNAQFAGNRTASALSRRNFPDTTNGKYSLAQTFSETPPPPFLSKLMKVIDPVARTQGRPTTRLNAMNSSVSAITSGFWLPEPAVEAGWEKPKTKPVQTDVEAQLWEARERAASAKKGWIDVLIYTAFTGSSTASAASAFRNLNELFR